MYADLLTSEKIAFRTIAQFISAASSCLDREHVITKVQCALAELEAWLRCNRRWGTDYHIVDAVNDRAAHWYTVRNYLDRRLDQEALAEASNIVGA